MVQGNVLGRSGGESPIPTSLKVSGTITTGSTSGRTVSVDFTPKIATIGIYRSASLTYNKYFYDGTQWTDENGSPVGSNIIRMIDANTVWFYTIDGNAIATMTVVG